MFQGKMSKEILVCVWHGVLFCNQVWNFFSKQTLVCNHNSKQSISDLKFRQHRLYWLSCCIWFM